MANLILAWDPRANQAALDVDGFDTGTGAGGNATQSYDAANGMWDLNNGPTPLTADIYFKNVLSDAGRRVTQEMMFTALPGAGLSLPYAQAKVSNTGSVGFMLGIDSAGHITIANASNAVRATGTTGLLLGVKYRITLAYTIVTNTSTGNAFKLWVNGNLEFDVAGITLNANGSQFSTWFMLTGTGLPANRSTRFGGLVIDDDASLAYPGDFRTTYKRPVANGSLASSLPAGYNLFDTPQGTPSPVYGSGRAPYVNQYNPTSAVQLMHAADNTLALEAFDAEAAGVGADDISGKTVLGRTVHYLVQGAAGDQVLNGNGAWASANSPISGTVGYRRVTVTDATFRSANAVGLNRTGVHGNNAILRWGAATYAYIEPAPAGSGGSRGLSLLGIG